MFAGNVFLGFVSLVMLGINTLLFMATFVPELVDYAHVDEDGHHILFIMRMLFVLNAFACLPGAFS